MLIAVMNAKGGAGKTSTTVNLAAVLASKRKRVLVVDMDGQCSATSWLGVDPDGQGLYERIMAGSSLRQLVRPSNTAGVDLVPSCTWMSGIEAGIGQTRKGPSLVTQALQTLPTGYDVTLVDCPPAVGLVTVGTLLAADRVIIPTEPAAMALQGLFHMDDVLAEVQKTNSKLDLLGVLVNRADRRRRVTRDTQDALRERYGRKVFASVIRASTRMAEAPSWRQPITQYAPASGVAGDYQDLGREVLRRIKG
jgi:chromosome partitioning protein